MGLVSTLQVIIIIKEFIEKRMLRTEGYFMYIYILIKLD